MDKPFYQNIQVVYQCPRIGCFSFFIARYGSTGGSIGVPPRVDLPCLLRSVKAIQHVAKREFSENVAKVSPDFCQIFWEAETADGNGLSLICGVGYRKSLEFLIKDFLVNHILKNRTEDQKNVKEGFLGWCISTYIDEVRIKKVAQRAVWLGNDETHYVRRWEEKDLSDLKRLISMTVSWIDLVMDSEAYQESMPEGRS